jgi:hypothetical protein
MSVTIFIFRTFVGPVLAKLATLMMDESPLCFPLELLELVEATKVLGTANNLFTLVLVALGDPS